MPKKIAGFPTAGLVSIKSKNLGVYRNFQK